MKLLVEGPLKVPLGGSARLRVALPPRVRDQEDLRFEASEPPEGVSVASEVVLEKGVAEVVVSADAAKARPGLRGNLVVGLSGIRPARPGETKPDASRQRAALGTLPAIPFEVVKP